MTEGAEARESLSASDRLLVAACGVAVFVLCVWPRERWVLDDALIFQNYVRSAIDGAGIAYGPGETTEGYSSPLWVLVLVTLGHLGLRGFLAAKIVGAICGAATVACAALLPKRVRFYPLLAGTALLALQPALAWWAASGMETPLVALLATVLTVAVLRDQALLAAGASGLLAIARPEGALYVVATLAWLVARALPAERSIVALVKGTIVALRARPRRESLAIAALLFSPAALWQVFRLVRYRAFVANSALAKLGTVSVDGEFEKHRGLTYPIASFFHLPASWLLLFFGAAAAIDRARPPSSEGDDARAELAELVYVLTLVVLVVAFIVASDGDWMPWSRFVLPIAPSMILFGTSRAALAERARGFWVFVFAAASSLALQHYRDFQKEFASQSGQFLLARWPSEDPLHARPFRDPHPADAAAVWYMKHLLQYTVPGDAVVHVDIGQSGYVADDVRVLDSFGLVTRFECEWLRGRRSNEELLQRFRELRPAIVFALTAHDGKLAMTVQQPLAGDLAARYVNVAQRHWWGGYTMAAWVRRDAVDRTPDRARMERWRARASGLAFPDLIEIAPP